MNEIYLIITLCSVVLILIFIWLTSKNFSRKSQLYLKDELIRIDKSFRDELSRNREETSMVGKFQREELSNAIKLFGDQFFDQLSKLIQTNEQMFDKLQNRVESQLKEIQENNSKKLEEMRHTVDEKLHSTLEKRLGESFKLVSERLEQVYKGLGDMQELARGVGDLKNVLANVKTRGGWGEIQLENLIEQILTRDQYEKNVSIKKGSNDKVEIAIKLPGRNESKDDIVWLPIDAKFPVEDYQRLLEAQETSNVALINESQKSIEARIKSEAKKIAEKYIAPPHTTDFAIMFLPIEGLYAEILRRPGIAEIIQREYRVTISGPTTLTALLNSLQMGFRTLAIEKRSSEVWKVLGSVKNEFGTFGNLLEKTQKKLQEASNTIDEAAKSTRKIEKHLNKVQELPSSEQTELLQ
jgi:DNA recombination protein RmuC